MTALTAVDSEGNAALASNQQNAGSVLHACCSTISSWFGLVADVERDDRQTRSAPYNGRAHNRATLPVCAAVGQQRV